MKLLKTLALLGLTSLALAGPSQPPAGNYINNVSTNAALQVFNVSSGTIKNLTITGSCTGAGCGSGGGGQLIYPSTGTPSFPFGLSLSTLQFTASTLQASQCLQLDGSKNVITSGGVCGGGSGGASALAVNQNGIQITSPTVAINGLSPPFLVTAVGGTTSQLTLDPSSVTLQGQNVINLTSALQSGSTFYVSSGTAVSLNVISSATAIQSDIGGGLNVKSFNGGDAIVIVSSYPASQIGSSDLLILDRNVNRNDPIIRVFKNASNSAPEMRWDSPAPNMEMVATSTDNTHGRGKWEPFATPSASEILQVNSRAWDNTTFETLAYWEPLDIQSSIATPGLFLKAQTLANDSGVLSSTNTSGINFFTQNNHTIGLTGPLNVGSGSWRWRLPSTLVNTGQILYEGAADSFGDYPLAFTTGGSTGQCLSFNSGGTPTWIACNSGGGTSTLQVTQSGVQITSPTSSLNFYGNDFYGSAAGTTAQIYLNPNTTDFIHLTSNLQSNSTFYVSSGSVLSQFDLPYLSKGEIPFIDTGSKVNGTSSLTWDTGTGNLIVGPGTGDPLGWQTINMGSALHGINFTGSGNSWGYPIYLSTTNPISLGLFQMINSSTTASAASSNGFTLSVGPAPIGSSNTPPIVLWTDNTLGPPSNMQLSISSDSVSAAASPTAKYEFGTGIGASGNAFMGPYDFSVDTHAVTTAKNLKVTSLSGNQCVQTDASGNLVSSGSGCGSGGSSSLGIGTGTSSGFTPPLTSTNTGTMLFDGSIFTTSLINPATAFVSLAVVPSINLPPDVAYTDVSNAWSSQQTSASSWTFLNGLASGDGSTAGFIELNELSTNGTDYVMLRASNSITGTQVITMPSVIPTANQLMQVQSVNGSSVTMQWATVTGAPGGPTNSIEVNGGGFFTGYSTFTINSSSLTLQSNAVIAGSTFTNVNGGNLTISTITVNSIVWPNGVQVSSPSGTGGGANPAGNAYDVQLASANGTQFLAYDNFTNNGTTVTISSAALFSSTVTMQNVGSFVATGFSSMTFTSVAVTLDNASPLTASTATFNGGVGLWNVPIAQLNTLIPSTTGQMVFCTDCTANGGKGTTCVSTGATTTFQFVLSTGTRCQ